MESGAYHFSIWAVQRGLLHWLRRDQLIPRDGSTLPFWGLLDLLGAALKFPEFHRLNPPVTIGDTTTSSEASPWRLSSRWWDPGLAWNGRR